MPTGCKSVYLVASQTVSSATMKSLFVPASDFKSGAKDLGSHEFGHLDQRSALGFAKSLSPIGMK